MAYIGSRRGIQAVRRRGASAGSTSPSRSFYVDATSGSDAAAGASPSTAWQTIAKVNGESFRPGDRILLNRGETWTAAEITISDSGTASTPVTLGTYGTGARPIIDGNYAAPAGAYVGQDPLPPNYQFKNEAMITLAGSYIHLRDIEVKRSEGRGVLSYPGGNNQIYDCYIHNNRNTGIHFEDSDNGVISNTIVAVSCDYAPYDRAAPGWGAGIALRNSDYVLVQGCSIYNNWGEGLIGITADYGVWQDNEIYDNFAVQAYLERSSYNLLQRNRIYSTGTAPWLRSGEPPICLLIADETAEAGPELCTDNTLINNLCRGGQKVFSWWDAGKTNSGLKNTLVAHNDFLDGVASWGALNFDIDAGAHSSAIIRNNIIRQDTDTIATVPNDAELNFSYNCWSVVTDADASGTGDVVDDPELAEGGGAAPGQLTFAYCALQASSPCRNAGTGSDARTDAVFVPRPQGAAPDMGAMEYVE